MRAKASHFAAAKEGLIRPTTAPRATDRRTERPEEKASAERRMLREIPATKVPKRTEWRMPFVLCNRPEWLLPSLPSLLSAIIRVIVGLAASRSALLVRTSDRKTKTSERHRRSHAAAAAAREQLLVNLGLRMKSKRTTTPSLEIFFLRIKSKMHFSFP